MGSQISLCRIHDNSFNKLFQEGKGGTLCDEVTHQKAISQKASLLLLCEDISVFTMGPYGLPSITLQNQRTTVLANCFKKGSVELCVMKSHIRKQSLKNHLSSYYVRIFPFSPWAPMGSPISLCRFHQKSVSKLLSEA